MLHPQAEWRWLFMLFSRRTQRKRKKDALIRPAGAQTNKAWPSMPVPRSFCLVRRQNRYLRIFPPLSCLDIFIISNIAEKGKKNIRRLPRRRIKAAQPAPAPGRNETAEHPLFTGKTNQAAHHVQPQGKGAAAENTSFFLHGSSLAFMEQHARKAGKYSCIFRSLPFLPFSPGCCR